MFTITDSSASSSDQGDAASNSNSENLGSCGQSPAASTRKVAVSAGLRSALSFDVSHRVHGDDGSEVRQQENSSGNNNSGGQRTAKQHEQQAAESSLMSSRWKAVGPLSRYHTAPSGQTLVSPRYNLRGSIDIDMSARRSSVAVHPHGPSEREAVDLVGTVLSGPYESPMSSISSHRHSDTRYAWLPDETPLD